LRPSALRPHPAGYLWKERNLELIKQDLAVLRLVVRGDSYKEIADKFGLTQGAIKQRMRNAKRRSGVRSTSHLVALALKDGVVDFPE